MDIDVWMNDLIDQLMIEFEERLVLVGLQGSRARGEQREDSDIDVVVIVKDLTSKILLRIAVSSRRCRMPNLHADSSGRLTYLQLGRDMTCSTW